MNDIGKGFSPTAFGNRFEKEVRERCSVRTSGKPGAIQALARRIVAEPDHCGVANALRDLAALKRSNSDFADIEMDCHAEFWEAIRLGDFADVDRGFAEITHRRTYSRPEPPDKAISTIHKAKSSSAAAPPLCPAMRIHFLIHSRPAASCMLRSVARRTGCCWLYLARAKVHCCWFKPGQSGRDHLDEAHRTA